jgi:hypothetical protein
VLGVRERAGVGGGIEALGTLRSRDLTSFHQTVLPFHIVSISEDTAPPPSAAEVVPFAVELRGGDPVISERLRA